MVFPPDDFRLFLSCSSGSVLAVWDFHSVLHESVISETILKIFLECISGWNRFQNYKSSSVFQLTQK